MIASFEILRPLLAVALARIDANGVLCDANAGFLRLTAGAGDAGIGSRIARLFLQPTLAELLGRDAGPGGQVHEGPLTLGDPSATGRGLRARVWKTDGELWVLAELDLDGAEKLNETLLALNDNYSQLQLGLVQTNLRLRQREAEILEMSLTDPLSGVGNRRRLEQALSTELSRSDRTGSRLCVALLDIDHFKRVNDTHGHDAGDRVIAATGELLRARTRKTDIAARFGGEEFVVLMPHTPLEAAHATADRLRVALEGLDIGPLPIRVTASFGVVERQAGESGEAALRRADMAMYEAKQSGRNRVVSG